MNDDTAPKNAAPRSLGWPGRIVVAAAIVAGVLVGRQSFLSLAWFVPFAGVGALLVIRRPQTSIGWLLLALGWGFVLSNATIDATVGQFMTRTVALPTMILSVFVFAAPGLILYLLAVLAVVFPSGRLPGGRWALHTRIALGVGLALILALVISPFLRLSLVGSGGGVDVPNPIALLPDLPVWDLVKPELMLYPLLVLLVVSVISLALRFRRSDGIERQQLRWFGASLLFVVLSVMLGLFVVTVFPATWDTGVPWYPATVAFPTVPIAIGIAVLRYRLYEIDTIINRAIVYGLLTAILAGSSAASIGLGQRLFAGVLGPGSDATIVVTTLLVVTAFTPVKNRLQAAVDRRFKGARDPAVDLAAFVGEVRQFLGPFDPDRALRRLGEVALLAYGASGAELKVGAGAARRSITIGAMSDEPGVSVDATMDGLPATLALSGTDASRDTAPLRAALAAVLAEVGRAS